MYYLATYKVETEKGSNFPPFIQISICISFTDISVSWIKREQQELFEEVEDEDLNDEIARYIFTDFLLNKFNDAYGTKTQIDFSEQDEQPAVAKATPASTWQNAEVKIWLLDEKPVPE